MKNNISLDISHPNKARVEFFLNNVGHRLEQVPSDINDLKYIEEASGVFKFKGIDLTIFVTVILADSYADANEIGNANSFHKKPNTRWTVNGDILFVVESPDEDIASEILGFFAGEE